MFLADKKLIAPKEYQHDPKIYNKYGNTVAVYLIMNNIKVPQEWKYDANYMIKYKDDDGNE